ncbi:MAG: ABC transporter substrate-binding protein [Acetobacteraceae bacterium]
MPNFARRQVILAGSATLALPLFGMRLARAQSSGVVKIGVTGPFSGPAAQSGLALKQGMTVAADAWNAKGGIPIGGTPHKVELLFEDTADNPAEGVSGVTKLITDNRVNFVIGDAFASSVTVAEMDLADQYKTPMMSCEPVSSVISHKVAADPAKYQYFWKADFNSAGYAATIHDTYAWLIKGGLFKPAHKTIAFIVEDTDYGRSIAALAADLFKKDGWKLVANNAVPLATTNFNAALTKLSYQNLDVLVSVFTSVDSGVALSKQFIEQGLKSSQFAIYYPTRPGYLKGAGKAAEGLMWAPLIFDTALRPADQPLNRLIETKYGTAATSDHAYGYDCLNIAANAFTKAASIAPAAVAKALGATDYAGILGRYVFDQKNHTAQYGADFIPIPTAQIQSGKNIIIWPEKVATGHYQVQPWMK